VSGHGGFAMLERAEVGSTNDEAWREGPAAFHARGITRLAVRADAQTAGRGRQGRTWSSPPGSGLYLSAYLRLEWPAARARYLTLAAGLALREACLATSGLAPEAKWPNDLLAPDGSLKKLAGVLTETRIEGGGVAEAVVGMGLNLRTPPPGSGDAPGMGGAVALDALVPAARVPDAATLAAAALTALAAECDALESHDGPARVLDRFRAACGMWGRSVRYQDGARAVFGEARDVAEDGGLVVRLPSGALTVLHAGDVHLIPVEP